MSIRERRDAENILANALAVESQKDLSSETTARIATIAKILDRCFDIIPAEFLDNTWEPPPSAWAFLNELYPEGTAARSKFLHRFGESSR